MSNVMIFCPNPTSENAPGNIVINGYAKENSQDRDLQWMVELNYSNNAAQMTTAIVNAVKAAYLAEWGIVIGGSDKIFMFGSIAQV